MACLFCDLQGKKENIVYEDDAVYVIMDRFPLSSRHLLVIPREHRDVMHRHDDDTLGHIMRTAKLLVTRLGMEKYNLVQNNVNGQLIKHCHLHVVEANESGRVSLEGNKSLDLSDDEYRRAVEEIQGLMRG